MSTTPYLWRKLTPSQRESLLAWRQRQGLPWHRPPHRAGRHTRYHVTAACYQHHHPIGRNEERMRAFTARLLEVVAGGGASIHAWCVLPNHYHLLVETGGILGLLRAVGQMHGRLSFDWNGEEHQRGRQVWCGTTERDLRNEAHFWATMNYVHHNPVRYGYVERWEDWPFSRAIEYLAAVGREQARRVWREYPILDYGKGWDDPDL